MANVTEPDPVNHPQHYANHPRFTCECIEITRLMSFDAGNAVKYLWRHELKGNSTQDLEKARWYCHDALAQYPAIKAHPSEWTLTRVRVLFDQHVYPHLSSTNAVDLALANLILGRVQEAAKMLDLHLG